MAKTTKALVKWDEKLAAAAKASAAKEVLGTGSRLSIKAGQLSLNGVRLPNDQGEFIIVDSCFEKAYYEGSYNDKDPQPPVCFAFGDDEENLKPHEKSQKPQHETCKGCPHNEWESASVGRGKACKDNRLVALLSATEDTLESAKLVKLTVPPTSLKSWKGYVHSIADTLARPVWAVITKVKAAMIKTYPAVEFSLVDKIDDGEVLEVIEQRNEEARKMLTTPYSPKTAETDEKPKKLKARKF
jgi:hypothetical protein